MVRGASQKAIPSKKSLRWHFFGKLLGVSVAFLLLTITALFGLLSHYSIHHNERQAIRIARSIDSVAIVTAKPHHLQHYVLNNNKLSAQSEIMVVSRSNLHILASSTPTSVGLHTQRLAPELRDAVVSSLSSHMFRPAVKLSSGSSYSILPLSAAIGQLDGDYPYGLARPMVPQWYQLTETPAPAIWNRLWTPTGSFAQPFTVSPHSYAGAIIVKHDSLWGGGLMLDVFLATLLLVVFGFSALIIAGWGICRRYITDPIGTFSHLIARLRSGERGARLPRFSVREFDRLARQWNALLNFRQSAESHQQIFSTIIENVPVCIEITRPDGRIEYANPAYQKMCGRPLMEIVGKTPAQFLRSDNMHPAVLAEAEKQVQAGQTWQGQITSKCRDGEEKIFDMFLQPIKSRDGAVEKVVAVRQDITERIRYEQELLHAKQKSEAADKAKSDFISRLSHELRTPFNAIIGFASIIHNQQMGRVGNPSYIEFASLIEQSANGLLTTINTLIELSRLDQPASKRGDGTMDPASTVTRIVRKLADQAEARNIEVLVHDELDGAGLLCEELHLQTLVEKLLSNALKFSHNGDSIGITLKRDDKHRIVLSVRDTGIGMAPDDIAHITEPFFQAANGATRDHEGLGVGLTLVQHLVNLYDAELTPVSELGAGTEISIAFPAARTLGPDKSRGSGNQDTMAA